MALQLISQGIWVDQTPITERSPSPVPTYDAHGSRNNTRVLRKREKLLARKDVVIEELVSSCATFRPPPGWRPSKKTRKLFVAEEQLRGTNLNGLLLGPRGKIQQEMEAKTGAKIALRCVFRRTLFLGKCDCVRFDSNEPGD
jgi:splicing factor 1